MEKETLIKLKNLIEKLKRVDTKLIASYQNGYLGKNIYEYTLNNGRVMRAEKITKAKRNGDAVVIIPETTLKKYVMIVEARPNTEIGVTVSFPAGMIDKNENPDTAARRELLEETGYSFEDLVLLEKHYQDQGCSGAVIYTYLATGCKRIQEQILDGEEELKEIELSKEDIEEIYQNSDYMTSANTKIAYLSLQLRK